ncbi:hypothetical protein SALBM311S_05975 [Streptomyces alboniger]
MAGFQGVSQDKKDITTLGRGGSDTTAVALAAALDAEVCEIYTDVDEVLSYQAVSGAGRRLLALRQQLSMVAGTEPGPAPDVRRAVGDNTGPFPEPVALNVVPWAGSPRQGRLVLRRR